MKNFINWRAIHGFVTVTLVAASMLTFVVTPAMAQVTAAERPREALVKAAFVHKFFSFVEWPEGTFARPDTPVRVGMFGDDEILQDLVELSRDRGRDGRPVTPVRIVPGDPLSGFHIIYIKASATAKVSEFLASIPPGVLTVADAESAHPKGSVLSFFVEDGRVRFGVSLEAAAKQKLQLNPRLLSVARRIQGQLDWPAPLRDEAAQALAANTISFSAPRAGYRAASPAWRGRAE
jgi:hypothetical protein